MSLSRRCCTVNCCVIIACVDYKCAFELRVLCNETVNYRELDWKCIICPFDFL